MEGSILSKILPKLEEKDEYFLSLEICPEKIKAAACLIKDDGVEVLATSVKDYPQKSSAYSEKIRQLTDYSQKSFAYPGSWEEATLAADEALAQVEDKFPAGLTVNKVVLGLPSEYIKDGKIEESHRIHIKELLTKLSLTPLGFVEIPLAIINFLQKQEGGPQTLILVRIGHELTVNLVRVGKITNSVTIPKTDNVALDLEKAIVGFTGVEVLPSRILLYDDQDLEKTKQQLINHPWLIKASFLHFPKIEIAPQDLDIRSVALAGASQLARIIETAEAEVEEVPGAQLGFVKDRDILEKPETVSPESVMPVVEATAQTPKLNFSPIQNLITSLGAKIGLVFAYLQKSFAYLKNRSGLLILFLIILLLIIGAGLVGALWYIPTAQVGLILETKTLKQVLETSINPQITMINEATKEIPAVTLEVDEKETKKATTTGKKTVGEPAKGEVTIYNKTTNSKTFKKGTALVAPNNLKFSLDDEVIVASASEGADYTMTPGKQNSRLTALVIGPEGNLGVGQEFHFAEFPISSYVAKNSVAFSGGTSREISVVSREDQDKLLASATAELTEMAKKDLAQKAGEGEKIIDKTIGGVVTSKKFDKEVDEETGEVSLELSMHFSATGYREEDLLNLLEKTIASSIPAGFEFRRDEVKTEIVDVKKKKDGTLLLNIDFSANLLPRINKDEIKKNLTGKSLKEAENYLRSLGNIAGYEIKFGRRLPFDKDRLPRLSQNLTIETSGRK